jgi:CheY-like chemotaxis protein
MSTSNADGTRGRILLLEDDQETALFAVYVLVTLGRFEVRHTADPAAVLRLVTAEHWDLLLTDLDMLGMTGPELLGALRTVAPGLPVAVVSAYAPGSAHAVPGQADEYLEKPLRVDRLIAAATALIARGRRPLATTRITITCGCGDRYSRRSQRVRGCRHRRGRGDRPGAGPRAGRGGRAGGGQRPGRRGGGRGGRDDRRIRGTR